MINVQCVIHQWIRLNKLYKLMKSFFLFRIIGRKPKNIQQNVGFMHYIFDFNYLMHTAISLFLSLILNNFHTLIQLFFVWMGMAESRFAGWWAFFFSIYYFLLFFYFLFQIQELAPMGALLDHLLDHPQQIDTKFHLKLWPAQVALGESLNPLRTNSFFQRYSRYNLR